MYGKVIETLPDDLIYYYQWPEFDLREVPLPQFTPELVGDSPKGVRWGWWPLTFEEYVSDIEPDLNLSDLSGTARYRIVLWRRISRTDKPRGWLQASRRPARIEGFADLQAQPDYLAQWDESARRYRRKWTATHLNKTHSIETVQFDVFALAYRDSTVATKVGSYLLDSIGRRHSKGNVQCIVARDLHTKHIIAGMALLHSPTYSGSYYLSGFIHSSAGKVPAMIGLMDYWYTIAQKQKIRFLYFGEFWQPGKPSNWKGFSTFKAKFGLYYLQHPPVLFKFLPGKFF